MVWLPTTAACHGSSVVLLSHSQDVLWRCFALTRPPCSWGAAVLQLCPVQAVAEMVKMCWAACSAVSGVNSLVEAKHRDSLSQTVPSCLQDPNMQKLLYPYLPPGMQNPETFEFMLKSPDSRKHLSSMLAQQVGGLLSDGVECCAGAGSLNSPVGMPAALLC